MKHFLNFFLLLILLCFALPAGAQEAPHAKIRLIPEYTGLLSGAAMYIGIEITPDPGWHVYWTNPGDSGEPMRVNWALPPGFAAGEMKWPAPEKILIDGLASYGYHGKTVILQEIGVPWALPAEPVMLRADVDILVCADICIPEKGTYEVTLNDPAAKQDNSSSIDDAYQKIPVPFDRPVLFNERDGDLVFSFEFLDMLMGDGTAKNALTFAPDDWGIVENPAEAVMETDSEGHVILRQKRGERPLREFEKITGVLAYPDAVGDKQAIWFTATPDPAWKRGVINAQSSTMIDSASLKKNGHKESDIAFVTAALFALAGGLILNLMPCVFPVLSLKALKLCRMGGEERAYARLHGLLYTGGILASFAVFAVLLLGLQGAGAGVGWGFHLQNPAFVAFLAYLFFLIALNLAGVFEIMVNIGGRDFSKENSYAATFMSGVLAAVVATPCTAPFMGAAMGYALTQTPAVTIAVFLTLGFGLALPYLVLSFLPALQSILPKPGRWMETFKKIMAAPMAGAAAWLAWVFMQQTGPAGAALLLGGMLMLTAAVLLLKKGKKILYAPAAILILAALYPATIAHIPAPLTADGDWIPYAAESFAALEKGDDALFVNMTAAWCITCKVNERIALGSDTVKKLFAARKIVPVKGDWTSYNAEITSYLQSFGRDGVPLYVFYPARGTDGIRPAPVVLPQLLTPSVVEKNLSR